MWRHAPRGESREQPSGPAADIEHLEVGLRQVDQREEPLLELRAHHPIAGIPCRPRAALATAAPVPAVGFRGATFVAGFRPRLSARARHLPDALLPARG